MIEEQEVMERTNSPAFCWSSTNKGSFGTIFYTAFSLRNRLQTIWRARRGSPVVHGPHVDKHSSKL
jgi:hypothetical protein